MGTSCALCRQTNKCQRLHLPACGPCSCVHLNHPHIGTFKPVIVTQSKTCSDAGKSVIPTRAECQQAATILELGGKTTLANYHYLPYCASWGYKLGFYTFDATQGPETGGVLSCQNPLFHCVCKEGNHACVMIHPWTHTHAHIHTHTRT